MPSAGRIALGVSTLGFSELARAGVKKAESGAPSATANPNSPDMNSAGVQEALRREQELALKRAGRRSTILTDFTPTDTAKKTLLGS